MVRWWDARREGKTFNVVAEIASNHFVPQLGYGLDDRGLEDTTRICPDSGLTVRSWRSNVRTEPQSEGCNCILYLEIER
jgi:hypothetical protein